jgi:hypothetical protein
MKVFFNKLFLFISPSIIYVLTNNEYRYWQKFTSIKLLYGRECLMKFLSSTRYVACLPVKNKILLCYFTLCALRKILSSIHQCFTSPPWGSCKQNLLSFQAIQIGPQCFGLDILPWFWVWIKNLINLTFLQSHQLATSIRTCMEP